MRAEVPFEIRLELARAMLAARVARPERKLSEPLHDQVEAAARDARQVMTDTGRVLRITQPDRGWREKTVDAAADDRHLYLLAAVLGCVGNTCPHLRREGPQPGFAQLALQRIVCRRCLATARRPPSEGDHQCDVCGSGGIQQFVPFTCASGPLLVMGDACPACASTLQIGEAAA